MNRFSGSDSHSAQKPDPASNAERTRNEAEEVVPEILPQSSFGARSVNELTPREHANRDEDFPELICLERAPSADHDYPPLDGLTPRNDQIGIFFDDDLLVCQEQEVLPDIQIKQQSLARDASLKIEQMYQNIDFKGLIEREQRSELYTLNPDNFFRADEKLTAIARLTVLYWLQEVCYGVGF